MPLYDMICDACGKKENDVLMAWDSAYICPECGEPMRRAPVVFNSHIFPAEGIFLKNVSATGKRFYSKQEMKAYAQKHDLQLGALE